MSRKKLILLDFDPILLNGRGRGNIYVVVVIIIMGLKSVSASEDVIMNPFLSVF